VQQSGLSEPVSDVALSTRRMSLTSVQLLSERVAPQPPTERGRETEGKKEERDGKETIKGGGRMCRDQRRKRGVWERKGTSGGREGVVKDNEAGEGGIC